MTTLFKPALLMPALLACTLATATPVPFVTDYAGTSDIVEVLNPNGPVVRFRTLMSGSGVLGLDDYFSSDIVDLSSGVGSGTHRFVADTGDELFGAFSVQIFPTAVAGVLGLSGTTQFTGGTGQFQGATGSARFTGTGTFISATSALSELHFLGQIDLVPEPGTWALLLAGLGAATAARRGGQTVTSRGCTGMVKTAT